MDRQKSPFSTGVLVAMVSRTAESPGLRCGLRLRVRPAPSPWSSGMRHLSFPGLVLFCALSPMICMFQSRHWTGMNLRDIFQKNLCLHFCHLNIHWSLFSSVFLEIVIFSERQYMCFVRLLQRITTRPVDWILRNILCYCSWIKCILHCNEQVPWNSFLVLNEWINK